LKGIYGGKRESETTCCPAMPIPREYAGTVINAYSEEDFITK